MSRGQFIRPDAGVPGDAGTYRLRAPSGALVALATDAGMGRLAPDKVLVSGQVDA